MDAYGRIVCKAFGVPDVLADDNQLKAASAALLRATGIGIDDQSALLWQLAAQAYIETATTMLREHRLDAVIGEYALPFPHDSGIGTAIAELIANARDRVRDLAGTKLHAPEAKVLASSLIDVLISWVRANPNCLREEDR